MAARYRELLGRKAIVILWQSFPKLWQLRSNIKYKGWNDCGVSGRFAEMFAAHTIDPSRVEFLGALPHAELLAEYQRIDLALDPFPYLWSQRIGAR